MPLSIPNTHVERTKIESAKLNANDTAIKNFVDGLETDISTLDTDITTLDSEVIKKDGTVDFTAVQSYPKLTITGITKANPAVVTIVDHTFINGDKIYIDSVTGMTEVNGQSYTVANKTDDTVELSGIDSSGYTTYTSGGNAYLLPKSNENLANQIYVTDQISKIIPGKGYIYGLECTNGIEGALQDLLVGTGECVDSTGTKLMKITSTIQKRLWESWAKGTNKGGRASGVSLSNATTYHTFIIADDSGNVDIGQDTDVSASNLLADSGYTYYRRIRSDITFPASVTLTGTASVSSGSATITGSGTSFLSELMAGNSVVINGESKVILSVTNDAVATATSNFSSSASTQSINLSSSPNLIPTTQHGTGRTRTFIFNKPVNDISLSGNAPTSLTGYTITAPPSSKVKFSAQLTSLSGGIYVRFFEPNEQDVTITSAISHIMAAYNIYGGSGDYEKLVDSSSKLTIKANSTSANLYIYTESYTEEY